MNVYFSQRRQHRITVTIDILFVFCRVIAPVILIWLSSNFPLFGTALIITVSVKLSLCCCCCCICNVSTFVNLYMRWFLKLIIETSPFYWICAIVVLYVHSK